MSDIPSAAAGSSMIDQLLSRNNNIPKPQDRPTVEPQNVPISQQPQRPTAIRPPPARPAWLPEPWTVDYRVRANGVSAGTYDRYYIDPVSKRRFRSRKEVETFLNIGSSKQPPAYEPDELVSAGWAFDPMNVPDEVTWSLEDPFTDTWSASIGSLKVDKKSTQNWIDHFNSFK